MLQRGFEEVETSFVCELVEFTVVSFGFELSSLFEVDGWQPEKGAVIAIALRRKLKIFSIAIGVPLPLVCAGFRLCWFEVVRTLFKK